MSACLCGKALRSFIVASTLALMVAPSANADLILFSDPSGLGAEAEFTILTPTTLQIRLRNTSTGVPVGFDSSDQLLTGVTFDFGLFGENPGDIIITGGTAIIGPTSQSMNFDTGSYGPGTNIGGEWGFGNSDGSGGLTNVVSGNSSQVSAFGGPNLDGPVHQDGPQAGLVASPVLVGLGGLGAIQDEIIVTLTLSGALADLSFLYTNGVQVEFGSDAAFLTGIPGPGALALILVGGLTMSRNRRRA